VYSKRTQQPPEPSAKTPPTKGEESDDFAEDFKERKRKVPEIKRVKRKEEPVPVVTPQRQDVLDEESDGEDDTLSDLDNAEPKVEQREEEIRRNSHELLSDHKELDTEDSEDTRRQQFVADIRRQSEEILNSINMPEEATPPMQSSKDVATEEDELKGARRRVDDLRRKSIELLNALDSPKGLSDFSMEDIPPTMSDQESDSELSDLENDQAPKKDINRTRLVENIQLFESTNDFEMRRESEELLTVIKMEEATSATRTPVNTPIPSSTSTPVNTPDLSAVKQPQDSPLQRVRLELRKLSLDIMQNKQEQEEEPSPSEDSEHVKSVLVFRDQSAETSPKLMSLSDREEDSFEGLLEEERKGPLVDDISESISDLEDAPSAGSISVNDPEPEPQETNDLMNASATAFELSGAGNEEFNGIYRWFHATNNYLKFETGATYAMYPEPFGESAYMWYISKIDENNLQEQYYSSFHKGEKPPEQWQCVIGQLPAPTLSPHYDDLGEDP